jgi:hypothetical protein
MPWQERSPMELRKQFVTEFRTGLFTMSELCAEYTISRKTGYKWLARADADGVRALQDQSRRPHGHPATTGPEVVAAIVAARRRFPTWSGDTWSVGWPGSIPTGRGRAERPRTRS